MSNVAANDTNSSKNVLKSVQVTPLPIGSGGKNNVKNDMNNTNTRLAMLSSQALADTMYDPPAPKPVTKQLIQPFCSGSAHGGDPLPYVLMVIASLCIVYGIVSK